MGLKAFRSQPNPCLHFNLELHHIYQKRRFRKKKAKPAHRVILQHYQARCTRDSEEGKMMMKKKRVISPIASLKSLHAWITWCLIRLYTNGGENVLDLACGKGGDLLKWERARVGRYVGVDMVEGLLAMAKSRYALHRCTFPARFVCADAYGGKLIMHEDLRQAGGELFDICSCQFALHYAWSSEERARAAMRNVASLLKPGGFFIGTLPDAAMIARRLHEKSVKLNGMEYNVPEQADDGFGGGGIIARKRHQDRMACLSQEYTLGKNSEIFNGDTRAFDDDTRDNDGEACTTHNNVMDGRIQVGNKIYKISFNRANFNRALSLLRPAKKATPDYFGIEYEFYLADAIDHCPEWLVPLQSLKLLGHEYGLQLVCVSNFHAFVNEHQYLLNQHEETPLYLDHLLPPSSQVFETISPEELECASTYLTFAFQKVARFF